MDMLPFLFFIFVVIEVIEYFYSNKMTKHKQAEREIVHGTVSVFPA